MTCGVVMGDRTQSSRVPVSLLRILMRLLGNLIWLGRTLSPNLLRTPLRLRHLSHPHCSTTHMSCWGVRGFWNVWCEIYVIGFHRATFARSPLTHTMPVLVPSLRRTARMAMRVSLAMSPGLSTSISEVAAIFDLAFHKRFRSSYDSSPSLTFPVRKRYRGTSELILDTDSEEDEEVEKSSDSDSEIEDTKEEGPTAGDEGFAAGDESPAPIVETPVGEPLGLGYGALRRREIASREGQMPSVFKVGQGFGSVPETERLEGVSTLRQPTLTTWIDPEDGITYIDVPAYPSPAPYIQTPLSPEWSSGSLLISPSPSIVPSPISSLTVPSPVASLATAGAEGFLAELGAQVEMQGGLICDHTERTIVMFGALWRYVLALEAWAGPSRVAPRAAGAEQEKDRRERLAQMATKGNLEEVVTTCERSWVQASPWGFSFRSERSGVYPLRRRFESCILPNWMSL
uniref:Uncharacterized protein n=1 Tax=Tanacetum cinerariifolium TaxID=118510 RepID=A0A699I8A2_TANCI|nr:hypothetical protein [Tanacetum cinerariifolium]